MYKILSNTDVDVFRYKELKNLKNMNIFQKINETGYTIYLLMFLLLVIFGSIIIIVCDRELKKASESATLNKLISIGYVLLILGVLAIVIAQLVIIKPIQTIGRYEAEAKVVDVDKQEKVGEKSEYTVSLRYKVGHQLDKKSDVIKLKRTQRNSLEKGDNVIIQTPKMNFSGGEHKSVKPEAIINDGSGFIFQTTKDAADGNVPDSFDQNELKIHKP